MSYPIQVPATYTNPQGNLLASGLYRSYLTQDIANDFPQWMALRQNATSTGQQLIAAEAILLEWLQNDLEYNIRSKFIDTSPVDDIDVLYNVRIPSTVNLLDASASGVRCIAAPQGYQLGGANQINVQEVDILEDFYYNVLPTRIEVISSGVYRDSINGASFNVDPSGIPDKQSKLYDQWKVAHPLVWSTNGTSIQKQDARSTETYENYTWNHSSTVTDLWYSEGYLWTISNNSHGSYLHLLSSKTQVPQVVNLDTLVGFNLSPLALPSGNYISNVMIDLDGSMWLSDAQQTSVYNIAPRYDYFIYDTKTRSLFFREDYTYSGVFISNT